MSANNSLKFEYDMVSDVGDSTEVKQIEIVDQQSSRNSDNVPSERSYYISQIPESESTGQDLTNKSNGQPLPQELAKKLKIAIEQNGRLNAAMKKCNTTLESTLHQIDAGKEELASLKEDRDKAIKVATMYKEKSQKLKQELNSLKLERDMSVESGRSASVDESDFSDLESSFTKQLSEHKTELEQLRQVNRQQVGEIEQLTRQLEQLQCGNRDTARLEDRIAQLEEELNTMSISQKSVQSDELMTLKKEKDDMKSQIRELEKENGILKDKVFSKDNEILSLQRNRKESTSARRGEDKVRGQGKLMNDLEEAIKDKRRYEEQLQVLKQDKQAMDDEMETVKEENKDLKQKLEKSVHEARLHSKEKAKLQSQMTEQEEDHAAKLQSVHREHAAKLQSMHQDHTAKLQSLHQTSSEESQMTAQQLRDIKQACDEKSRECNELKSSLEQQQRQANAQIQSTEKNLNDALQKLKDSERHIEAQNNEIASLHGQVQQLESSRQEVEDQLQYQLQEANEGAGRSQQNVAILENVRDELQRENHQLTSDKHKLEEELSKVAEEKEEAFREWAITMQELEESAQKYRSKEVQLKQTSQQLQLVTQERDHLKNTLDEKMRELQMKNQQQQQLEGEISQKERDIRAKNDDLELLRNQVQQYARDFEEESNTKQKFAAKVQELNNTLAQKDREIDQLQNQLTMSASVKLQEPRKPSESEQRRSREIPGAMQYSGEHPLERGGNFSRGSSNMSGSGADHQFAGYMGPDIIASDEYQRSQTGKFSTLGNPRRHPSGTFEHQQQPPPVTSGYGNTATAGRPTIGNFYTVAEPPVFNTSSQQPSQRHTEYLPAERRNPPPPTANTELSEPCPLCGKRFNSNDELVRHASTCT